MREIQAQKWKPRHRHRNPRRGRQTQEKGYCLSIWVTRLTLRARRKVVPGTGLRHLASWDGATGPGAASFPGEQGEVHREVAMAAGRPGHAQNVENASACPGMSPSGSKCLAGGRSRQAAQQPPHTCCPK